MSWVEFKLRLLAWARSSPHLRLVRGQTDEMEFLPAAVEIMETPPKPAGRVIAGCISLFLAIAAQQDACCCL